MGRIIEKDVSKEVPPAPHLNVERTRQASAPATLKWGAGGHAKTNVARKVGERCITIIISRLFFPSMDCFLRTQMLLEKGGGGVSQ